MSHTMIKVIAVGVALSAAFALRWQRHTIMRFICPREILLIESIEERNRICDRGFSAFLKHWRTWISFMTYAAGLALASLALSEVARAVTQGGQWSLAGMRLAVLLPAICEMTLIPLMIVRYRKWMRVFLRQNLNNQGIAICQDCGYDLRGQVNPRCPECGAAFERRNVIE